MNVISRNQRFLAPFLSVGLFALVCLTAFVVCRQGWPELSFNTRHYVSFGVVVAGIGLYWIGCSDRAGGGHRKRVLGLGLAAFLWILISGKMGAGIAVILFFSGSYALGRSLLRFFEKDQVKPVPGLIQAGLGLFLGMGIHGYALWIAMHFKVNFPLVYSAIFLGETILFNREIVRLLNAVWDLTQKGGWSTGQVLIFSFGLLYLPYSLVSFYVWDDIGVHLFFPKRVSLYGIGLYDPAHAFAFDHSIVSRSAYTAVYLLGGEFAVRLLNFALFPAAFLLLERWVRLRWGARTAGLSLLAALLTPFLVWQWGAVFIDAFALLAAVILLILLFRLIEAPHARLWFLFGLVGGFAYLCKQMTIFVFIPMAFLAISVGVGNALRKRGVGHLGEMVGAILLFAILLIPVFYWAYRNAGSAGVYHLDQAIKNLFGRPPPGGALPSLVDLRWKHPLNLSTLWAMTFKGSGFIETGNYSFGFLYFIIMPFLPLLWLNPQNRRDVLILALIFVLSSLIWFGITGPYLRYFLVILPVGSILLGLTLTEMLAVVATRRWTWNGTILLLGAIGLMNFMAQITSRGVVYPFPLKESLTNDYTYSGAVYRQRLRRLFDFAGIKYGKEAKGLFLGSVPELYFADFHIEGSVYYQNYLRQEIFDPCRNAGDLFKKIFDEKRYDFIIAPEVSGQTIADSADFRGLLRPEISAEGYSLYVPKNKSSEANSP